MKPFILACAFWLVACNALIPSDMPNLEDPESIKAAVVKLDPIAPGGPPNDTGIYGMGQPGSERYLFVQWLHQYVDAESARSMNIDHKPAPFPGSIAEAIEQERQREAAIAAETEKLQAKLRDESAAASARRAEEERALAQRRADELRASDQRAQLERAEDAAQEAVFKECDRQREAAQAKMPLEDGYATYRSFACEQKLDDARAAAQATRAHTR